MKDFITAFSILFYLIDLCLLRGEWKQTLNSNNDLPPDELVYVLTQFGYYFAYYADQEYYRKYHTDSPIKFFERKLKDGVSVAESGLQPGDPNIQKFDIRVDIAHEEFDEDSVFAKIVNEEASADEFWAYLSYGDQDRLAQLLKHTEVSIPHPSKNAIGIVSADDEHIEIKFEDSETTE